MTALRTVVGTLVGIALGTLGLLLALDSCLAQNELWLLAQNHGLPASHPHGLMACHTTPLSSTVGSVVTILLVVSLATFLATSVAAKRPLLVGATVGSLSAVFAGLLTIAGTALPASSVLAALDFWPYALVTLLTALALGAIGSWRVA
jgi:hypothetical protein